MARSRPSGDKRRREREKQRKRQEKQERRKQRKEDKDAGLTGGPEIVTLEELTAQMFEEEVEGDEENEEGEEEKPAS